MTFLSRTRRVLLALAVMGALLSGLSLTVAQSASAATALCNTTLRKGDTGSCVSALQTRLNELGSDLAVDGSFGGKTEDEVYAFQGRSRIGFDGIVGPTTRSYLANPGTVRLTRTAASTIGAYIDSKFGSAGPHRPADRQLREQLSGDGDQHEHQRQRRHRRVPDEHHPRRRQPDRLRARHALLPDQRGQGVCAVRLVRRLRALVLQPVLLGLTAFRARRPCAQGPSGWPA